MSLYAHNPHCLPEIHFKLREQQSNNSPRVFPEGTRWCAERESGRKYSCAESSTTKRLTNLQLG